MKPLFFACLAVILFVCEGAPPPPRGEVTYCPAQGYEPPPTLEATRDFPTKDANKAISKAGRELQETLKELEKGAREIINQERKDEDVYCVYPRQCDVVNRVVNNWKLPANDTGVTCWLIEAVVWRVCDEGQVPNFNCGCVNVTEFGFACVQQYQTQSVWVYCDDGNLDVRNVPIASGCEAMAYFCDPTTVPVCEW